MPACTGAPTVSVPASGSAPMTPRTRKSPCSYSGLPPPMTIPSSSPLATSACWWGSRPSIASRSVSSAGRPASSRMTWPSAAVTVSSGPTGAAPCETHGITSTPAKARPTAPSPHRRSPRKSAALPSRVRALAMPPSTGTPGSAPRQLAQHEVGRERVGVGEQDDGGRVVELGQPADRDRVGALGDVEVEGLGAAVAERGGPHRDGGAALDLAPVADHAAGAAADQHRRRERLVDALERGLGRRQVRAGGEDADDVGARAARAPRAPADPPRSPPGAGRGRSTARSRCARSRA